MKVVVAIDSLKGSLTSLEAGEAIREGVLRAIPEAEVVVRPLADGGEGTVEALTLGMGGRMETATVTGPLGRPVACACGTGFRGLAARRRDRGGSADTNIEIARITPFLHIEGGVIFHRKLLKQDHPQPFLEDRISLVAGG